MMELLPPVGWGDVARQRDLDRLEAHMDRRFAEVDRRFGQVDRQLAELDQRFATKDDLRDQTSRFIGWMVAGNATLVAAVGLIVSLA